ncbi:hypothetical protein [Candidatus Palauibacter sp.]|uniref:hypothetical protein n=1 Tax=Candidatus Palauibacter sp. TaxID=3101350 RepID=UPI003B5B3320
MIPATLALSTLQTGVCWQCPRGASAAASLAACGAGLARALRSGRPTLVGVQGHWMSARESAGRLELEIGHRLCGRGWLLRLEMPPPRGDPARGTLSLEGLLRVGELEADAREIGRELSAIARDTAWAWLEGRSRSRGRSPSIPWNR